MDLKFLNEGAFGGGHMNHLYDNPKLTFGKIKQIFKAAANGELIGTEKADGQNLSLTFKVDDKKAYGVRNEGQATNGGINAVEMYKFFLEKEKEAEKKAEEEGKDPKKAYNKNLKHTFSDAVIIFEKIMQKLSTEEQKFLFEEGDKPVFYNCEVMDVRTKNVVKYDVQSLIVHRVGHYYLTEEYEDDGSLAKKRSGEQKYKKATPTNLDKKLALLEKTIKEYEEEIKKERFRIEIGAIRNLEQISDEKQLKKALNRIDNLLSSTNYSTNSSLTDESTIEEFVVARIKDEIKNLLLKNQSKIGQISPITFLNIVKRIYGAESINKRELDKQLTPEQKKFVEENIFNDSKKIFLQAIVPLEHIVSDFASDMLQGLKSVFIGAGSARGTLEPNKAEVERLRKLLDLSINTIKTSNNQIAMDVLQKELQKLKSVEKFNVAAEGFVFEYDGVVYKFTGNFAPANQLLGLFKYGRAGVPAMAKDLGDLDPEREEEPGFIGSGEYPMNENKIGEKEINMSDAIKRSGRNAVCLYVGRFQPMGKHHAEVFRKLQNVFGSDRCYLVTSNKVELPQSPLSFEEKVSIMVQHADITPSDIIQSSQPYLAEELLKTMPADTIAFFAVGEKDMEENPRFATTKTSHYQLFDQTIPEDELDSYLKGLSSYKEHGYLFVAPTVKTELTINGKKIKIKSGTEIRKLLASGDKEIFKEVMGFFNNSLFTLLTQKSQESVGYVKPPPKRGGKKKETKTESILHDIIDQLLLETIKKRGNKYCLVSKKSGRNLGCYRSRGGAEKREKQVQYFKHIKEETGAGAIAGTTLPLGARIIKRTKEEEN